MTRIEVRDLTPDDWPVVEELFGERGACGGCWCMAWRLPNKEWEAKKGAANKRAFRKLVTSGAAHGCVAFAGGEPVGWVSIGPRADFQRLVESRVLKSDWDADTWSVTCFYVPSAWRGHGVATKLLKRAATHARALGAKRLEGYPVEPYTFGKQIPAAFAWTGVHELYERAGFRDATPEGNKRRIFVRRFRKS